MEKTLWNYAEELLARGLHVFPLSVREKITIARTHGFKDASNDPVRARLWWAANEQFNVGVACGLSGITVRDIDEGLNSFEEFEAWRIASGLPITYTVRTGKRSTYGVHMYYRGSMRSTGRVETNGCFGEIRGGVLIDGEVEFGNPKVEGGGYVVGAGSIHPSGARYEVIVDAPFAELPDQIRALALQKTAVKPAAAGGDGREKLREGDGRNMAATRFAGTLVNSGITSEKGLLGGLRAWSDENCADPLPDAELRTIAHSAATNFKQTLTSVHPDWEPIAAPQEQDPQRAPAAAALASPKPPKRFADSDTGNQERLAYWFGDKFKYCPQRNWYMWDGKRWVADAIGKVQAAAQLTARAIVQNELPLALAELDRSLENFDKIEAETAASLHKFAMYSESRKGVEATKAFAKASAGIAANISEFDQNNWLFNCENMTLGLYEHEEHRHRQSDMITCISPVVYDPAAKCPQWDRFLQQIMSGNADNIGFLQRAAGYSLTGSAAEHCMFFLFGNGRNGKSTFVEVLKYILGDYGKAASMGMFLDTDYTAIPSELAGLAGKRFVSASETKEGRAWDEAKLKQITGGDTVVARFLYQKEFEFKPEFKIWCSGNHRPKITGTDDGIWSRLKLIPFTWQVAEAQKDKFLRGKLQKESAGILNWMLAGLHDWQKDGLRDPVEVVAAVVEYRNEENWLTQFLQAETETGAGFTVQAKDLYDRFKQWAFTNKERQRSSIRFNRQMDAAGIKHRMPDNKKVYRDLRLKNLGTGGMGDFATL